MPVSVLVSGLKPNTVFVWNSATELLPRKLPLKIGHGASVKVLLFDVQSGAMYTAYYAHPLEKWYVQIPGERYAVFQVPGQLMWAYLDDLPEIIRKGVPKPAVDE